VLFEPAAHLEAARVVLMGKIDVHGRD
jgi:hypothetical protein